MSTKTTLTKFQKGLLSLCAFMAAANVGYLLLSLFLKDHSARLALSAIPGFLLSWYVDGVLKKL